MSEFGADTPVIERYLGTERLPAGSSELLGELGKPTVSAVQVASSPGRSGWRSRDLIVAKEDTAGSEPGVGGRGLRSW